MLSFSRNFPDLEIHNPNIQKTYVSYTSQSVCVCMSIWPTVIDEVLVCNNIHNPFAVAVQKEYKVCMVWPDLYCAECLSPVVLAPTPGHPSYFGISRCIG